MIAIVLTILFLIGFSLVVQRIKERLPKASLQAGAILEIIFIILIVLAIVVPNALDIWLK